MKAKEAVCTIHSPNFFAILEEIKSNATAQGCEMLSGIILDPFWYDPKRGEYIRLSVEGNQLIKIKVVEDAPARILQDLHEEDLTFLWSLKSSKLRALLHLAAKENNISEQILCEKLLRIRGEL